MKYLVEDTTSLINTLHTLQKWRRGANIPMPDPKEFGKALDETIRLLRKIRKDGLVSKKEVLDKVNITKGAMILDGYESCIKYMEELEKEI